MPKKNNLDFNTKVCSSCNVEKHVTEYYVDLKNSDNLSTYCKDCTKNKSTDWYSVNKERSYQTNRKNHLMKTYGITLEQYDELLEKQNQCCAVCLKHEKEFKMKLAVDHNHKTGEIRGLLCTNCNHRLIGRHTDAERLRRMAAYIDQGTGWYVPPRKRKKRTKKK